MKKVKKYNEYFKANVLVLKAKQFPNDGANSAQLKKVLGDVTNVIDGISNAPQVKTPVNFLSLFHIIYLSFCSKVMA